MPLRERAAVTTLAIISIALRAVAFFRYRFDSDEPQHLHVAWGWTAGLLQYRDVFDNHAPLLHIASAPILRALGERENILLWMRAPMLPLFAIVIAATYILGARMYSRRVGIWSAVLCSLLPPIFLKSLEYRTDNLWNALWFLSLLLIMSDELRAPRAFAAGFLLGCALATSMKTSLLVITLAAAATMTRIALGRCKLLRLLPLGGGFVIAPSLIVAYFAWRGALINMLYCVISFNELLTRTRAPIALWIPRVLWLPLVAVAVRVAWRLRPKTDDDAARRRFFLGFASAFFIVTLICFWILVSPRDFLPVLPLLTIFGVAWFGRNPRRAVVVYVVAGVVCVGAIAYYADRFADRTREQFTMMHQLLRLTRPGEPVIDYKGETVYRPRPYYYILESITRNAMQASLIPDTIAEDVVRAGCHVAQADGEFWPARGRVFLHENFLDMGRLRAAGKWLKPQPRERFTIAIPGTYVVVDKKGQVRGVLDGTPYDGPRYLPAGVHRFDAAGPPETMACLWAPAFQRGFSPFHLQDRDF